MDTLSMTAWHLWYKLYIQVSIGKLEFLSDTQGYYIILRILALRMKLAHIGFAEMALIIISSISIGNFGFLSDFEFLSDSSFYRIIIWLNFDRVHDHWYHLSSKCTPNSWRLIFEFLSDHFLSDCISIGFRTGFWEDFYHRRWVFFWK